jgi:hypothetical protein
MAVSRKFKVSVQSICKWSRVFGWKERIKERDKKNTTALAKKTDDVILKTKLDYRIEVQQSLTLLRAAMTLVAAKIKNGTFKAETAKDLGTLVKAQDAAIRLEQLLAGEIDSNAGTVININLLPCDPVPRTVESEVVE